jgi:double-GTPase-like protein
MSRKLTCPFCYKSFRRKALFFQCLGRSTATSDGCRPVEDEARRRLTGFAQQSLPAFQPTSDFHLFGTPKRGICPRCGGESRVRACPHCHTRLPYEFGTSASPLVAMVGARGTGKTVYLTVLSQVLQSREIRRAYNVDVHLTGDGLDGFTSAAQWMQQNVRRVYRDLKLFETTPQAIGGRKEPLVLEWRSEHRDRFRRRSLRTSYLSFYDTAGEDLTNQSSAHELHYLGAADSLILLLDPFMLPKTQQLLRLPESAITSTESTKAVLVRITEALRASPHRTGALIDIPVAVAFVKMDAFYERLGENHPLRRRRGLTERYDEYAGRNTHEMVAALLDECGGADIDYHLHTNYRDYRYFFVSALGAQPDYEHAEVDSGGVQPDRVEEPLLWLLRRKNVLPRNHR